MFKAFDDDPRIIAVHAEGIKMRVLGDRTAKVIPHLLADPGKLLWRFVGESGFKIVPRALVNWRVHQQMAADKATEGGGRVDRQQPEGRHKGKEQASLGTVAQAPVDRQLSRMRWYRHVRVRAMAMSWSSGPASTNCISIANMPIPRRWSGISRT